MTQPIIYSRNDLKALKEETDRIHYEYKVEAFVKELRGNIVSVARTTNNTSFFRSIILSTNPEDEQYKIVMDVITRLKEQFIDVSIEYKSQTDIRTGREFNQGIYVDWS